MTETPDEAAASSAARNSAFSLRRPADSATRSSHCLFLSARILRADSRLVARFLALRSSEVGEAAAVIVAAFPAARAAAAAAPPLTRRGVASGARENGEERPPAAAPAAASSPSLTSVVKVESGVPAKAQKRRACVGFAVLVFFPGDDDERERKGTKLRANKASTESVG